MQGFGAAEMEARRSSKISRKLTNTSIKELSSLIRRAEDPIESPRVIAPLMEMLVGGELDLSKNFKIYQPSVLLLMFDLLPHFSEQLQVEIWTTLTTIWEQSLASIQACRPLRLIEHFLRFLRSTSDERVAYLVVRCVELVGGHHITLEELHQILSHLYTGPMETWAPHSIMLLGALRAMSANIQPDVFFSFSGGAGAALTLPPLTKWPTQSGFTFNTWIRLENPDHLQREDYRPTVYWFRTGRPELGYSAHLVGSQLVLETVSRGKKPQTHVVDFTFRSYRWYMVTVAYVHNRIRSSQLCCLVDGQLLLTVDVTLPNTDDVFDKCFLGSTPASTPAVVYEGQMAAVYLFKEPLNKEVVRALHRLGPGYKSQFKFDAECDVSLTPEEKKLLFDGHLSSAILFSYNAKAVDGQLCLEASPSENQSFFAHSPHATLLEGVVPVKTTTFHSILHSLGGLQALMPLLSQLDTPQESGRVDYTLSVKVVSVVFEMALKSSSFLLQLLQTNAMELFAFLLEKVSPQHLTLDLISSIFSFLANLLRDPGGGDLAWQVIEGLLFNPALWIRADRTVQVQLYSRVATEFSIQPIGKTGVYLRERVDTDRLLFIIREFYDVAAAPPLSLTPHEDAELSEETVRETRAHVRPYLILILKEYFTKGKGIQPEDMKALLDYLSTVPNEDNLHDVLSLLLALVFEDSHHPGNIVKMFYDQGGINVAAKLLACSSEELTLNALKLIGMVFHHSSQKERQHLLGTVELLTVVREKLLSAGQPVTIAMFNTLYEVLVDCPVRKIIDRHYVALDLSHRIENPGMLSVMIELICSLHTSFESWEEGDTVMRMQLFTYVLSLCSQSSHNCKALLKLQHWQHWFLMLSDQPGAKESDGASLWEMVYKLFLTILVHAFQEEQDGWRVWLKTAASLHAYMVSKNEEENSEEAFGDSPAVTRSDSTGSGSGSNMKVGLAISRTCTSDSTESGGEGEGELESAESSAISLSDSVPQGAEESLATPSTSPRAVEVLAATKPSGRSSPAIRRLSMDAPPSPLFMPKNPFLDLGGKITKFKWTSSHINLLEDLLVSISGNAERLSSRGSLADYLSDGGGSGRCLRQNVAYLLALTLDSVIALGGGLRPLLSQSATPLQTTKKQNSLTVGSRSVSGAGHSPKVRRILELSVRLAEGVVLSGQLKLSQLEGKLKMDVGGLTRQCLRLVLASASLSTIQRNIEHRYLHSQYSEEKLASSLLLKDSLAFLQSLGLTESSMIQYFESTHQLKLRDLKKHQQLLCDRTITHLRALIAREKDNKSLVQQMVVLVMTYLSTMCVATYNNILTSSSQQGKMAAIEPPDPASSLRGGRTAHSFSSHRARSLSAPLAHLPVQAIGTTKEGEGGDRRGSELGTSVSPTPPNPEDVSEQVQASMEQTGPFLCELLLEHKGILSKVLVGADGRQLISDTVVRLAKNKSIVEMIMLLCSQEWQSALKKNGGKVFSDFLSEGKKVSKLCEGYLRTTAAKTTSDLEHTVTTQAEKFTDFEERLSLFLGDTIRATNEQLKLKRAEAIRCTAAAKDLWRKISSVVNDKGFFEFTPLSSTAHWRLDLHENSLRQHLQLLANPSGTTHEEAVRVLPQALDSEEGNASDNLSSVPNTLPSPKGGHLTPEDSGVFSEDLLESLVPPDEEPAKLLSILCWKVVLAHAVRGTLVLTASAVTFTADDTSDEYEKVLCMEPYYTLNDRKLLEDITAVFTRRYLHQKKALEVFFADRTSVFLVFETSAMVGEMVRRLPKVGAGPQFDLPQARSISLASPRQIFKKSNMTAKWVKREISNFEYLMYLNTIAGRSYNDLNQYPVFPWILKDYSSQHLDLNNLTSFRDLTKPMGAINPNRLEQFEERYNSLEDDSMPRFFYGTHYSTMAFVLHWLLRVEPFSTLHVNFHDGLFDHSARLFASLKESWTNSTLNSSDVNELIPEFFYLPEMFQNSNKFNLGRGGACGEGEEIGDVVLPPWTSSVQEFVYLHREALESEYVSSHLHHWIDLIFGYKQRGSEAVKAKNVFYYLTYIGSIDLDAIEDAGLRKGLEDQIRNFGQTPSQLLSEPHPPRQPLHESVAPQPVQGLNPRDAALLGELQVTPDVPIALVQLSTTKNDLLVVSCNQLYAVNKWIFNPGSAKNLTPTVAIEPDKQIASGLRVRLGDPLDQSVTSPGACFTALPSCSVIIVCGFWDNSFKCFDTSSGNMLQSVFGHRHIVSCVDFSPEEGCHAHSGAGLIATGSHDATVQLWRWSGRLNRVVSSLSETQSSLTPLSVCTGHRHPVVCLSVSASLGILASGAKHGSTLIHSVSGELLHNISPGSPGGPPGGLSYPHLLRLTRSGHLVVHYADQKGVLVVFSCNGHLLSQHQLNGPALALAVSEDGRYVVSGGFDCTVRIFSTYNLRLCHAHPPCPSRIRSLHLSKDQRYIFAGLASGSVSAFSTHCWFNS